MRRWVLLPLLLLLAASAPTVRAGGPGDGPRMVAHFIHVGQGQSVLLEFPCGMVLIDTGAESNRYVDDLVAYLEKVFSFRPDRARTLDLVLSTHVHTDHTRGLRRVVETFNVRRYIDNGRMQDGGKKQPKWVRENSQTDGRNIRVTEIRDADIPAPAGLTSGEIDPVQCPECDPVLRVLTGDVSPNPGWTSKEWKNPNNHSIVTRVDFGETSLLFTGDLETPGIGRLLERYAGSDLLDVDVYQVGHHGAADATTRDLLHRMTPAVAVMPVGEWRPGNRGNTAFGYGHPRLATLQLLSELVPGERASPKEIRAPERGDHEDPGLFRLVRRLYGTGWDGNIRVGAGLTGNQRVTLHH